MGQIFWKNALRGALVVFLGCVLSSTPVNAILYAPGETLDPACAPGSVNCGVASVVETGVQGQVPYYAANGGVLSATSSITILQSGNVGIGTTTPGFKLDVQGIARARIYDSGGQLYNVKAFGALGNGTTDDTIAIQAAIDAALAAGSGTVYFPGGTYLSTTLTIYTKTNLLGDSVESAIIKLKNGTNADLIKGQNFDTLTGTDSVYGIGEWSIRNLTLDGNKANNTSGTGIRVYGYNYIIEHVHVRYFAGDGMYSEWSSIGSCPGGGLSLNATNCMEAHVTDLNLNHNGGAGLNWNGPHDTILDQVIAWYNVSAGVFVGNNAGGTHITNGHSWGYTQAYAYNIASSSVLMVNNQAEGASIAQVQITSSNSQVLGGVIYNCPTNSFGIVIGATGQSAPRLNIDSTVHDCITNFVNDGGGSKVKLLSSQAVAQAVTTGTPSSSTHLEIKATQNGTGSLYTIPENVSIGGTAYGTTTTLTLRMPGGSTGLVVKGTAASTQNYVGVIDYLSNNLFAVNSAGGVNIGATTTTATNRVLTVQGNAYLSGALNSVTLNTEGLATVGSLSVGSLSGILKATAGSISTSLVSLTSDITGVLGIANGGTATTTQVTNGITYFNGTSITSSSGLVYNGTGLGINITPAQALAVSGAGTFSTYLRVGGNTAPGSTGAGDITASRLMIGLNSNFTDATGNLIRFSNTVTATSGQTIAMNLNPAISPASDSSAVLRMFTASNVFDTAFNFTGTNTNAQQAGWFENRVTNLGNVQQFNGVSSFGIWLSGTSATLGTVSEVNALLAQPVVSFSNTLTSTITKATGLRVMSSSNTGTGPLNLVAQAGVQIDPLTIATNNTYLLLGTTTVPTGNFGVYSASANSSYYAGNLGVGTTTPTRKLSVTGTVGFSGLTASVGAGSICLSSAGEVVYNAASDNCLSSTRETKHAIESLALSELAMLEKLNPVSFVYNGDPEERLRYGFIADEADAIDPHLATRDLTGKLSGLDTSGFLALIVGAVQELSEKVTGFADSFTTNHLCVGETCVTESEFKSLLEKANTPSAPAYVAPTVPEPEPEPEPDPAPALEEPVDEEPAPEPIAEPSAPTEETVQSTEPIAS